MEDKLVTENNDTQDNKAELNKWERYNLKSTGKWARFIAITGLSFLGIFMLLFAIEGAALFLNWQSIGGPTSLISPVSLFQTTLFAVFVIYFPMLVFLLQFGIKTKNALNNQDSKKLEEGLMSLKQVFVIAGVYTILVLFMSMYNFISPF